LLAEEEAEANAEVGVRYVEVIEVAIVFVIVVVRKSIGGQAKVGPKGRKACR